MRACVRELQRGVGKGRTLLLGEDDFDHTPKELAAVPVLLGVLRILVVEELDEGERLLPPARRSQCEWCVPGVTARARRIQSSAPQSHISNLELRTGSSGASCHGGFLSTCLRARLARARYLLALHLMLRMNALGPLWRPTHFIPLAHINTRLHTVAALRVLPARLATQGWAHACALLS